MKCIEQKEKSAERCKIRQKMGVGGRLSIQKLERKMKRRKREISKAGMWAKQTQSAEINAIYCPFKMEGEKDKIHISFPLDTAVPWAGLAEKGSRNRDCVPSSEGGDESGDLFLLSLVTP